jgi:hypothetical protein
MGRDRRRLAGLALAVAEAAARGDETADGLLVEAFTDLDEAVVAHAYLSGWVLQLLAASRHEDVAATLDYVRSTLTRAGS